VLYIGSTLTPCTMYMFKPSHRYRPSHWLTAVPHLEHELQMIIANSSPRGNDKERKLLVMSLISFFLKKEEYFLMKVIEGNNFISLRLTWKEMRLLDDLWWGPGSPLSEEELSQVMGGPGAREFYQELLDR
jgi:hypothetical protein